jgi:hypothetical protein
LEELDVDGRITLKWFGGELDEKRLKRDFIARIIFDCVTRLMIQSNPRII